MTASAANQRDPRGLGREVRARGAGAGKWGWGKVPGLHPQRGPRDRGCSLHCCFCHRNAFSCSALLILLWEAHPFMKTLYMGVSPFSIVWKMGASLPFFNL